MYTATGNYIGQGGYGSKTAEHIKVSPTSSLLTKKVQKKRSLVILIAAVMLAGVLELCLILLQAQGPL